ncbi:MAG: zinc ribbon domain-containing protein [archaeon]|nr:zinc ribbon domain-containing protein [archaeon]MCR4323381.1 zinc ribbon domain-containing protein [Nanoarchaeota archaeon]
MLKKKCPACAIKIERRFNFCPHCGKSFKEREEKENYGMLGREDNTNQIPRELKLPFGLEKIAGPLIEELMKNEDLNKIMNDMTMNQNPNRKIQIKVIRGKPPMIQQHPQSELAEVRKEIIIPISEEEMKRRITLPKVEAESSIKRLDNRIIYIIDTPGVKQKKDVIITTLASGIEIKAYSKDYCYVKYIPMTVEVIEYNLRNEKLFLEIKA